MNIKVSRKDYWDGLYKELLRSNITGNYWTERLLTFVRRYLTPDRNKKFVEVGGAPGVYPILFYKTFQYEPYIMDYSEPGIEETRRNLEKFHLPKERAILIDFLDDSALSRYKGYFDTVLSTGFLEHFKMPSHVLNLHLKILKNGGDLIIKVPSYNLIFGLQSFLKKGVLEQHNLSTMRLENFSRLFISNKSLEIRYLGYFGGINLGIFRSESALIRRAISVVQNAFEFTRLEPAIPLNRCTSPYLICIAKKKVESSRA